MLEVWLGDVDGVTVGKALRACWPTLPIVFTTGDTQTAATTLRQPLADPHTHLLEKPYPIDALGEIVSEVMRAVAEPAPAP